MSSRPITSDNLQGAVKTRVWEKCQQVDISFSVLRKDPHSANQRYHVFMDDARKRSLALAQFDAFRNHPPSAFDEDEVTQFHQIVTSLEEAWGEDLSAFRIPDSRMKRRVISVGPVRARPGRPPSGGRKMSDKRYCDGSFMRRQMEGIVSYFQNLQAPSERRKIGF